MTATARLVSKKGCSLCAQTREFLKRRGITFQETVVDERTAVVGPQLWIGSTLVGGYAELLEWDTDGRLDPLLR